MDSVETYLKDVRETHDSGAAVPETSYYPALRQLLNDAGQTLAPRVRCVVNLRNRGAGIPDGGLFSAEQFRGRAEDESAFGALPSRGAIEVKPPGEDVNTIADSVQVRRYLGEYRQVLVTNLREFLLVVTDDNGEPRQLEHYVIASNKREFWTAARTAKDGKRAGRTAA